MLYATMAFWLMIVVLAAWGVHHIWGTLVRPKVVNIVLLPGTLVAQLGHVVGLLVTGGTINNTTLIENDETAAPAQSADAKPRIPIIGPVIVAMLPLVMCAGAVFLAARLLPGPTVTGMTKGGVSTSLPITLAAFWQLLHSQLFLMEATLDAVAQSTTSQWQAWLFIYLLICLTVRMAPFPGNTRGALGAIVLLGLLAALLGVVVGETATIINEGWSILSLSVTTLLLLLMFSLLVRGLVSLVGIVARKAT